MKTLATLGKASELLEGTRRCVTIGGIEVTVLRDGGKLHALRNRCPHAAGRLGDGEVRTERGRRVLVCPLHRWAFDLENGSTWRDRKLAAEIFPVAVEADSIVVELPEPLESKDPRP